MKLKKIIINNKKGGIIDLIIWLVMSFILIIFFAVWILGFDTITNTLASIPTTITPVQGGNLTINMSEITADTFGKVNTAQTKGLHVLAFVMIFMMAVSILVTNFLVKAHPAFFIVFLMVTIGAVIVSVYLSNQYEVLMTDVVLGATLTDFTAASFIMINLPIWTTVIGIFSAIFLFAGILRDKGLGEGVV